MKILNLKNLIWSLPIGLMTLAACSSGEPESPKTPEKPDPVQQASQVTFASGIQPSSKATDLGFEVGDEISVFAVDATVSNGYVATSNYADNVRYTYGKDGLFSSTTPIYYNNNDLYFKAVYPYSAKMTPTYDFTIKTDQTDYKNYTLSDLMIAQTAATHEEIPYLEFQHCLANIVINLSFESERPSGTAVAELINVNTTATLDINQSKITVNENKVANVKMNPNGLNSFKAIVVPNTKTISKLHISIGDKTYEWNPDSKVTWSAGRQYTYDLVVTRKGEIKFTTHIIPWDESPAIEDIIPPSLLEEMEKYIPIPRGTNPPNVEGCYLINKMETVYCQDQGNGGYDPGTIVNDTYIKFSNQNNKTLTLDYEGKTSNSHSTGNGSYICGNGNDFTVYFDTEGVSYGITTRTALVISGTKTASGIQGLRYAFVMVEKGDDPSGILMQEGIFRIFRDQDELSVNATWPTDSRASSPTLPDLYLNWK